MSENTLWVVFWVILGFVSSVIIGTIGFNVYQSNKNSTKITMESLAKGTDPIAAKCAMLIGSMGHMSPGEAAVCSSAAAK